MFVLWHGMQPSDFNAVRCISWLNVTSPFDALKMNVSGISLYLADFISFILLADAMPDISNRKVIENSKIRIKTPFL